MQSQRRSHSRVISGRHANPADENFSISAILATRRLEFAVQILFLASYPRNPRRVAQKILCGAIPVYESRPRYLTILNGTDAVIRSHAIRIVPPVGVTSENHHIN